MPPRLRVTFCRVYDHAGHAEHLGFVAVAFVDVFHLHQLLGAISCWLLVTGGAALYRDLKPPKEMSYA